MRTLVYRAGVLGRLYAARLALAGDDVTILARGQRLSELRPRRRDRWPVDVLGMRAIAAALRAGGTTPPLSERLYWWALAGDLASNSLYYSLAANGAPERAVWRGGLLGLGAGIATVALPPIVGLGQRLQARTPQTALHFPLWSLPTPLRRATLSADSSVAYGEGGVMRHTRFGSFVWGALGLSLGVALVFGLLRWLGIPTGQLLDWVIGLTSFWWLLVVVTIPWNIHFGARAVVSEAAESHRRGLAVDDAQVAYARRWVSWSLPGAVALHAISAAGLYWFAAAGISAIGYLGAAAALLLTGLRPAIAGYAYVSERLAAIGQAVRYPREDILTLRSDLREALGRLQDVERALNPEEVGSLAAGHGAALAELRQRYEQLRLALDALHASNASEHARLSREAEQAVARISADGQVLDHVRELIRFFKSA